MTGGDGNQQVGLSGVLEDSVEDLYDNAPCGYLSTRLDGTIAKINATLLRWLGYSRDELVGHRRFADLLTVGGRIYSETHLAPLLQMQGQLNGIALEMRTADGTRLPVFVTSVVKAGDDGQPLLIRTTIVDARERRSYEAELLRASQAAEDARRQAEAARAAAQAATATVEVERVRLAELARTLQKTLLPPRLLPVPGLDVAAAYHAASVDEVGGDFYDLFALREGAWGLFLGDVCGKGAEAAAITSLARYTLRAAAVYDSDPAVVLRNLNTVLLQEQQGRTPRFCTVVFGVLTPAGTDGAFLLTLAAGGHPPAVMMRADGTAATLDTPGGQLMGVFDAPRIVTATVRLEPGDTLLLYTDGLTEARSRRADSRRYGEDALLGFATSLAPTTATEAVAAVTTLLDGFGAGVDDDTALLALSVPASTSR
ncbi:PP2C family protein-serine/threonine phosphatase [Cryptosporangium sp. NPDC048952]|uniref:PP2C family protein-serine/threonine phosphatase n=1 Tax=Cryptosporangium sp. NPDC048952 TaxID=3363961 RepID=UPI003712E8A3